MRAFHSAVRSLKAAKPSQYFGRGTVKQLSSTADSFLSGSSSVYVDQMYRRWLKDRETVHASWDAYFTNLESGLASTASFTSPDLAKLSPGVQRGAITSDSLNVSYLIRAYQVRGFEVSRIDPLNLNNSTSRPPELDYKYHGFTEADLKRKLDLSSASSGGNTGFLQYISTKPDITLQELIDLLEKTYCNTVGVEYMHIPSREKCNWIRSKVENIDWMKFEKSKKLHIFERLCFADHFEDFLHKKFTDKRFGLNGGESCIAGLKAMIDRGKDLGIEGFVFGMPHRGRLNVLANVMRKPMPQIFKEFRGGEFTFEKYINKETTSSDVKYHLGASVDRTYDDGKAVHLTLIANPSHLEAVNPVVIGKVRAKQFSYGNKEEDKLKVMPVLLHGDAAFAGQGIVYETMQMSKVPDFAVGGTVHVIVNNQVGFTTDASCARSTAHPSDLGKAFNIPIFHCNADDPLAVVRAFEMAVEYRQQYREDCIINFVCYRRYGHNEGDNPWFTQPLMYRAIKDHPSTFSVYEKKLLEGGDVSADELSTIKKNVLSVIEAAFEESHTFQMNKNDWLESKWKGYKDWKELSFIRNTGVDVEVLRKLGHKLCEIPSDFNIYGQLRKVINQRNEAIAAGSGVDWATAEALAFGTLLLNGYHLRLTGQDVERGTFSHRHAVYTDQENQSKYVPLRNIASVSSTNKQEEFTIRNSILSEFGVMGFEYGYSLHDPRYLVLWEAQFGDFVNGAQVMIDQFITSGEDKWLRQSGLVLLLPHGYMGQGAEHSSCRIERFLQQVREDGDDVPETMDERKRMQIQATNFQVLNCTTAANYFHAIRRQCFRDFRKPLVIATPKSLLRDARASSTLAEMGEGTRFKRVIREQSLDIHQHPENVKRLIFCTGKVYYDLAKYRDEMNKSDVAIIRIEQLAPFPFDKVAREMRHFENAEVVWCQEEPKNMGAWSFVEPRIASAARVLNKSTARAAYIGRPPAAATATGWGAQAHKIEQDEFIHKAIGK